MADPKKFQEDFDEKHNIDTAVFVDGRNLFFSDGAIRSNHAPESTSYYDPPKDPQQLAWQILLYWRERERWFVRKFNYLERELEQISKSASIDAMPLPSDYKMKLKELKTLAKTVQECREGLKEAEENVEKAIPQVQRDRAAAREKRREAGQKLSTQLHKIEI